MITEEYKGITISYNEESNTWQFTLRNRERECSTLVQARAKIDQPLAEAKEQNFEPVEAWLLHNWRNEYIKGRVTSQAVSRHGVKVWFISAAGERGKEDANNVFPATPEVNAAVVELKSLDQQVEALNRQKAVIYAKLKPIKL